MAWLIGRDWRKLLPAGRLTHCAATACSSSTSSSSSSPATGAGSPGTAAASGGASNPLGGGAAAGSVVVGSANFPESELLAEVYALAPVRSSKRRRATTRSFRGRGGFRDRR